MDTSFSNDRIDFDWLNSNAFNYRWAEVGEGVIPLTSADSDFHCPPLVTEGLLNFVSKGYFLYGPKLGFPEVKVSIATYLKAQKNEDVDPEKMLLVDSAARGMYIIAESILRPGDEVLIFDPVDYLFAESTKAAGGVPVLFPAVLENGRINLDFLESYITPKTRMIGLCNPHNPLGVVYCKDDLLHILHLAEKYDLYIMNDEIWSDIVYEPHHFLSILSLGSNCRVISVYGFSKAFALAGLRVGCVYTDNQVIYEKMIACSDMLTTAGGTTTISQIAAKICMDQCLPWNRAFVQHLKSNRDYALSRISKMPLIECHVPQATFLLFPSISQTGLNSLDFATYIEKNYKLAVVPGTPKFFGPGAEGHIRISYATSREVLEEGLNRLEIGLTALSLKR